MAGAPSSTGTVVGDYVLSHQIGSGSFAVVWKAQNRVTGEAVAVKEINVAKLNRKLKQSLEGEVSILRRISHENIVKLHQVIEDGNKLYLVMEYCAGGDLAGYIRRCKRVPESVAQHLLRQLAAGLKEMWSHHLVHRDLKPQNLLLSDGSPNAVLKIADFGFARALQPHNLAETLCGSPLYMAPEILQFHKYDSKADLWSVGTILYELVVGRPPFTGANHVQLLRAIERTEARIPAAMDAMLSAPCRALILSLLKRAPVERIAFEEFFSHPFLNPEAIPGGMQGPAVPATSLLSAQARSAPMQKHANSASHSTAAAAAAATGKGATQAVSDAVAQAQGDVRCGQGPGTLQGFPFVVDNHLAQQPLPPSAITGPAASQVRPLVAPRRSVEANNAFAAAAAPAAQHPGRPVVTGPTARGDSTRGHAASQRHAGYELASSKTAGPDPLGGQRGSQGLPAATRANVYDHDIAAGKGVMDSIEDDYVLVDSCPIASSSRGHGASSSGMHISEAGLATGSLPKAPPGVPSFADRPSATAMAAAGCEAANATGIGGNNSSVGLEDGSMHHSQGMGAFDDDPFSDDVLPLEPCVFPLQPTEQEVMWEVARTLDYLAYCQQENGRPEESLSLQLLSLDLLLALLRTAPLRPALAADGMPTAAHALSDAPTSQLLLAAPSGAGAGPSVMENSGSKAVAGAAASPGAAAPDAGLALITQAASKVAANAQAAAERLVEGGQWSGGLPDVVGVVYSCARHMGRGGAVEELLGNHAGALHAYTKAGTLLYFLCTDLELFEQGAELRLGDAERRVVHRLVLHTSTRYQACKQALAAAAAM